MNLTCVIPWDEQENIYKTVCSIEQSLLSHLVSIKALDNAKDIEDLPNIFEVEALVYPQFIGNEKLKVYIYTKIPIPQRWINNQEIIEANKGLILGNNIGFSLFLGSHRYKIFDKQAITINL